MSDTTVRLSVLIATKNRPGDLLACLRTIIAQEPRPDEVVVVDQSPQSNAEAVRSVLAGSGVRLCYDHAPHLAGLTHARNHAVGLATGEILLFLDDDMELLPGYLRHILGVFTDDHAGRIGGAGGLIINLPGTLSRVQRLRSWLFYRGPFGVERDTLAFHLHPGERPRPALRLHGGDMALRREVFAHVRFDEGYTGYSFGEDRDFTVQVARHYELRWVPLARVIHKETPRSRITRERFCELRILSWRRFYDRCVERTAFARLCYLWLNVGFVALLFKVWDWPTVRGTARGLWRLLAITLGREPLERALQEGWRPT